MSGKTLKEAAAEKLSSTITVQGITVEGVTPETVADFEFVETIGIMTDPDADDDVRLRAILNFGPTMFGAKQWKRIKRELREQSGGVLPQDVVMDFFTATLVELKAKNS